MAFEFFIGKRYLRARKKQAFLSLITLLSIAGVTVGVMALIVVIAVMAGFESDLKSRILGVESHVVLKPDTGFFDDYRHILEVVDNIQGVELAAPFISSQVMLRSAAGVAGAALKGIDPEMTAGGPIKAAAASLQKGSETDSRMFGSKVSALGIVLGRELAGNLGLVEGDTVYLISPRGIVSPVGHIPSMHRFWVAGLFESGMYEYDASLAYISLKDAQKILRMTDSVTGIEVWTRDIFNAGQIAEKIIKRLDTPCQARNWMQMNQNLFSALKLEKIMMFIILALIVLVAAFNIASVLIMTVIQKKRDIAILKAMGATNRSIQKIFVLKGMVIGATGTILGSFFGFLLCFLLKHYQFIKLPQDVYYVTSLPIMLETADVFLIAASALVICFAATLYPARQAARINPVEAIRYG
ncbi:MAG: lipoprotein-releasing ABC transporter permease subunit [Deltaproteobacteria bacterium]|nr:lipoprotein-releasing ABC transporter permease subunit [Deltaproteobacteria bacterium]